MSKEISRRAWLKRTGLLAGGAMFHIGRSANAVPAARVTDLAVISHQRDNYHGWSTLARRRNGELLVACSGGRESHVCPFGRVELIRSRDDGRTWSWPRVVLDSPIDDRDAGVLETARGSILITTFTSLAYENSLANAEKTPAGAEGAWNAARLEAWRAVNRRIDAEARTRELGVWMVRSTDGGITFSERYDCLVNSPHGPVQLSDGRLIYAGADLWRPGRRVGVCESTDDGQSWRWLAEIKPRDGDDIAKYHELHVVEAADGRLVLQIRNHNPRNHHETLQAESHDGGKTWTTPHEIGVWGLPSHLLRLADGRLLMSYGHRRAPFGNQARVSSDHGRTWSEPVLISGDGHDHDLGYPTTVQLADGSLLTVWYERLATSPKAVLRQARWTLDG